MPLYVLGPSYVAEFARTRCARRLAFSALPPEERVRWQVPTPAASKELKLRWQRGFLWERKALRRLLAELPDEAQVWPADDVGGRLGKVPAEHVHAILRHPGPVRWLVQPVLQLPDPEVWARRFGWPSERVGLGAPVADALELVPTGAGRWTARVLELKRRYRPTVAHRYQLAFYTMVLEELVRQLEAPVDVDTHVAWIWCGGWRRPRRIRVGAARVHVETLLRTTVPEALQADPGGCEWHVSASCVGCRFLDHCRSQAHAADDLAQVPGLPASAKRHLQARGIRTAEDWYRAVRAAAFRGRPLEELQRLYAGHALLERHGEVLAERLRALKTGRPFLIRGRTHYFRLPAADDEQVALGLAVEWDPGANRVLAVGLRWRPRKGEVAEWAKVTSSPRGRSEAQLLEQMLAWLRARLAESSVDPAAAGTVRVYAWEPAELRTLWSALWRHGLDGDPAAQLFRPGRRGVDVPSAAVQPAIYALWALPEPFVYSLEATVRHFRCPIPPPPVPATQPFASRLGLDVFEDLWSKHRDAAAVDRFLAWRAAAVLAVLDTLRRPGVAVRFYVPPRRKRAPPMDPPRDAMLAKLATFVDVEQGLAWEEIRDLYACALDERVQRGESLGRVFFAGRTEGDVWAFRLESPQVLATTRLREGDYPLVLTPIKASRHGHTVAADALRLLLEEPWRVAQQAVELVRFDPSGEPLVWLRADWDAVQESLRGEAVLQLHSFALDRGFLDITSQRMREALAAWDREPARWRRIRPLFTGDAASFWTPALPPLSLERLPGGPADHERAIAAAASRQPALLVWGPPGTGKTHLLARLLVALADGAARAELPCRIVVTAFTHRAVDNLLERVATTAAAAGVELALYRLHTTSRALERWRGAAAAAGIAAGRFRPEESRWLVAGTVWALAKEVVLDADLVVIDEASQMTVPQALVALRCLNPDGALWAAGDPRQLGPILRSTPPSADRLFASLYEALEATTPPHPLTVTHRSNRVLVTYPRERFYPGYASAPSVRERRLVVGPLEDPIAASFLDPDRPIVFAEYGGPGAAMANAFEAQLVAHLLAHARAALRCPDTRTPYSDEAWRQDAVAVLTPHRAQIAAVLDALRQRGFAPHAMPVVDTVERLQGSERELIVVSTAVADPDLALAEASFLFDERRFNVCITRARSKLIVLVHRALLELVPHREELLQPTLLFRRYRDHLRPAETLRFQDRELRLYVRSFEDGV